MTFRSAPTVRVSDHALLRFLQRAGCLDTEGLRTALGESLARAGAVAELIGQRRYQIRADGLVYVVRDGVVVTVFSARPPPDPRERG